MNTKSVLMLITNLLRAAYLGFELQILPAWFVQENGCKLKLQDFVVLRTVSSTVPFRVRLRVMNKNTNSDIYFGKGWKAFAKTNGLMIGNSLIFELRGMSEFQVHIFRGSGNTTAISSSHLSTQLSTDSELISQMKNGQYSDSSAGCSTYQHISAERSDGSLGSSDDLYEVVLEKKRKIGEKAPSSGSAFQFNPENSCAIKLRLSELVSTWKNH